MAELCPVCGCGMTHNPRYPLAVCKSCKERVTDADGRGIELFQAEKDGSYAARYTGTGEDYPSHECYIDGIRCWAREAHFGGIVVQTS